MCCKIQNKPANYFGKRNHQHLSTFSGTGNISDYKDYMLDIPLENDFPCTEKNNWHGELIPFPMMYNNTFVRYTKSHISEITKGSLHVHIVPGNSKVGNRRIQNNMENHIFPQEAYLTIENQVPESRKICTTNVYGI